MGDEKDNLEKLIRELGLQSNMILIGTKPNVIKKEVDASLYVRCSDYEGFPNAFADAVKKIMSNSGLQEIMSKNNEGIREQLSEA